MPFKCAHNDIHECICTCKICIEMRMSMGWVGGIPAWRSPCNRVGGWVKFPEKNAYVLYG